MITELSTAVDLALSPLAHLQKIEANLRIWLVDIEARGRQIALALQEVHENSLWKLTHLSFDEWGTHVFGKKKSRIYQLLAWAKMPAMVSNERQAREIADMDPELQALVMEEAGADAPPPKIRIVRRRVEARMGNAKAKARAKTAARAEAKNRRRHAKKLLKFIAADLERKLRKLERVREWYEPESYVELFESIDGSIAACAKCRVLKVGRVAKAA